LTFRHIVTDFNCEVDHADLDNTLHYIDRHLQNTTEISPELLDLLRFVFDGECRFFGHLLRVHYLFKLNKKILHIHQRIFLLNLVPFNRKEVKEVVNAQQHYF